MRYQELNELKTDSISGGNNNLEDVTVAINPNKGDLKNISDLSKTGQLRGYYDHDTFYFWDSYDAIHSHAASELGLVYQSQNRLMLDLEVNPDTGEVSLALSWEDDSPVRIPDKPWVVRNFYRVEGDADRLFVNEL